MNVIFTLEESREILNALSGAQFFAVQNGRQLEFVERAADIVRARLSAPEPEPVAIVSGDEKHRVITFLDNVPFLGLGTLLYTSQPQREWQGLTDEERDEICLGDEAIARAIEAKLKEKNT